jgi:hypothetical protein
MHPLTRACCLPVLWFVATPLLAQDYSAEAIDSPPPTDELAPEIAELLAPTGVRVVRGEDRMVLEFWPTKTWKVQQGFQPTLEVLYPFNPGELMGVVRLSRRWNDFRDQPISRGIYTLRYMLQPVDGNHVGTSPTRDFFLLVRADADQSAAPMETESLNIASAEAAESSHPAMLSLQPAQDAGAELPTVRHDEARDLWILRFAGKSEGEDGQKEMVVEAVVIGHAQE